jgi:prolyl oligopeptidase
MVHRSPPAAAFALLLAASLAVPASAAVPPPPVAKQVPVTDTYFGTAVVDPYRWMEEPASPDLAAYLKAQGDRTRAILDSIPGRKKIADRVGGLLESVNSSSGAVRRGSLVFYQRITPGANVAKLYVRSGIGGAERVLLDPATLAGKNLTIVYFVPSNSGKYVAVGLSAAGAEDDTYVRILNSATGAFAGDRLEGARFGVTSWTDDDKGLYYDRLSAPPPGAPPSAKYENIKAYRHSLGAPQRADVAVFGNGLFPGVQIGRFDFPFVGVSPDSRWAAGIIAHGVQRQITCYVLPKADLGKATAQWKKLFDVSDNVVDAAGHGDVLYVRSAKDAPRFKVLKIDLRNPAIATAATVIPASSRVIDSLSVARDALYVASRENGLARISRVAYGTGAVSEVKLPVDGTASNLSTETDKPGFLVKLESWTTAPQWYAFDATTKALAAIRLDPPSPVDYSNIVSEEVNVPARDGVLVPLSIVHAKNIKKDGSNPTLLYAYGSYGISSSPNFSPARLTWFEQGGILAVAHVRGGGENGEEWHLAGKDANKVNTIGDYIDTAKWLIANAYTSPAKLGGRGGSAGGITMGGAITQAPQLFAAILDEVPVSDALRSEFSQNGPPNIPEFGSVKTEQGFKNLYAISAVQHVVPGGKYPAVLLNTGLNDPRVDPWQAAKMAAVLQANSASGNPILLRVDAEGGHGVDSTKAQIVQLIADEYTFLLWNFGIAGFQPTP